MTCNGYLSLFGLLKTQSKLDLIAVTVVFQTNHEYMLLTNCLAKAECELVDDSDGLLGELSNCSNFASVPMLLIKTTL